MRRVFWISSQLSENKQTFDGSRKLPLKNLSDLLIAINLKKFKSQEAERSLDLE